jgi:hypothetical protein
MRPIHLSRLHTILGVTALLLLTGAKGQSCGGGGEPPPEPDPCPPGEHLETVCLDPMCNEGPQCEEICVPDNPCPEGTYEEWVCEEPVPMNGPCLDPNGCPEPAPPPECYPICVPIDPCGPDMHEEWVCEEPGPQPSVCLDPNGCPEPAPPPECYPVCVPDACTQTCDSNGCWEDCTVPPYDPGDPQPEPTPQ